MAKIVVLGAGVCGIGAGLLLAREGHDVTMLERDPSGPPESVESAWEDWSREGVTQFRQAHFLPPGGRMILEELLPDVFESLMAAGATRVDALAIGPQDEDSSRPPGAERFVTYSARRPTIERVFACAAEQEPRLEVRRGVAVGELVMQERDGTPHVTGARTEAGEVLEADLVVDAMGRGSQLPRWLGAAGVPALPEEAEDSGFIYYTRFFRSADGNTPMAMGPLLAPIGTFSVLTLPGDNGTWSVTVYISSGDRPLKRIRETEAWSRVVAACPLQAHWLEGEPISGMEAMGGVVDRHRRTVVEGQPVLTGLALLGDAAACTNPSLGRGITLGLLHAKALRETVSSNLDGSPLQFARAWDTATEERLMPWYRETVAEDRARLQEIEALREGADPTPSDPGAVLRRALVAAMPQDPELFLAFLESRCCITPLGETFAREGVSERIMELAAESQPMAFPGPSRAELLELLA